MDIDINTNLEHRKIVFSSITTLKEYISNRIKKISEIYSRDVNDISFKILRYNTIIDILTMLGYNDTIDKKELLDWINSNYKNIIIWYILQHEEGTHFDHIILDNYKILQIIRLTTSHFETNHKTFYIIKWLFTDLFEKYSTLIINSILAIDCSLPSFNGYSSVYPFKNYDVIKLFYDMSLKHSEIIFNKQLIFNNYCLPIYHDFNDNIKIINWLYGLSDIDICNKIYYDNKTLCLISIVKKYEILKYFYAIYEQLNISYDYEKDTIVTVTNTNDQLCLFMHSSLKAERRIKILEKQNKIIPDLLESISNLSNRLDKIEHNPFFLL